MQSVARLAQTMSPAQAEELRQKALDHVWFHSGVPWEEVTEPGGIKLMAEGNGAYLTDVQGKTYLDCYSGLWLVAVGYGRKEIADAVAAQTAKLHYTMSNSPTEPTIRLASKLAELTPGSLSKCFFVNSGSEANETAMKMAIQYHYLNGEPKRYKIIGRKLSYHGATFGTMGIGGARLLNRAIFEPLLPGARLVAGPYQYSCEYCRENASCNLTCAYELERAIQLEGPGTVAAFLAEPISHSSGDSVPPPEYWPAIRAICDRYGVLLICDEVITGFGRTGKMFAVEHWDLVPDIMTVAKGLTSGYVPMGAAIAKAEIAEKFKPGLREAFQHVLTFGGHAVASAAALANLEIIEREKLVQNAATMGSYLLEGLRNLHKHPSVGDTRGLGLMCAVELAKDKKTRAGFNEQERRKLRKSLTRKFVDAGILMGGGDRIPILPPLVVQKKEIDTIVGAIDRALSELEKEESYWS